MGFPELANWIITGRFFNTNTSSQAPVVLAPPKDQIALFAASQNGHSRIVELLLLHDQADPNQKDDTGWTALHLACARGQADVVTILTQPR